MYSYLKCIVYDKLLKPRQSFRITLCTFGEQHQYTILSVLHSQRLECAGPPASLPPCVFCIAFPRPAPWPGFPPLLWPSRPHVPSSVGRGVPAAVNLSLPHTTFFLTSIKVYGYRGIILKWIFKKWDWEAWTELIWARIRTGGGRLWAR